MLGWRTTSARSLSMPRKYRNDLNGRITFLSDSGLLPNAAALHEMRSRRNDLAHENADAIGWDVFDADASVIEDTLSSLGRSAEVDTVQDFRATARGLQDPVHGKKRYFTSRNVVPVAVATFATERTAAAMIVGGRHHRCSYFGCPAGRRPRSPAA